MASPHAAKVVLTEEERRVLEGYARRRKTSQSLAKRSRIVLLAADGLTNQMIAAELGTSRTTVKTWRNRFAKQRLEGLHDEPRPGAPRTISDDDVERVIAMTLETTPREATHWSTRLMAKHSGLSHASVQRIWRAFGLSPHRSDTFTLSNDPLFVEKVRDVVGLYLNPPEHAVVLCVDEKSQIQALDRTQPIFPMTLGQDEKRTGTYRRHGTTSLFAAIDTATGKVIGKCYRRRRVSEFRAFLNLLDREVPDGLEVHIIVDNLNTHKAKSIQKWFARHRRFHIHFIPTYSSWLNLVERWFGLLEQRQIKRGSHRSVVMLERAIYEFIETHNEDAAPFKWVKSADDILLSLKRFCERTLQNQGQEG
jgi:putative transposase